MIPTPPADKSESCPSFPVLFSIFDVIQNPGWDRINVSRNGKMIAMAHVRARIDMSVYLKDGASAGVISGFIELHHLPRIGEYISLLIPRDDLTDLIAYGALVTLCKVESIIHHPVPFPYESDVVQVGLRDLIVADKNEALKVAKYLEMVLDFDFDSHMENE